MTAPWPGYLPPLSLSLSLCSSLFPSLPPSFSLSLCLSFSLPLHLPFLFTCLHLKTLQTRSYSTPKVNHTHKVTPPSSGCGLFAAAVLPLRLAPRRHRPRRLQVPAMSLFLEKVRGMSLFASAGACDVSSVCRAAAGCDGVLITKPSRRQSGFGPVGCQ